MSQFLKEEISRVRRIISIGFVLGPILPVQILIGGSHLVCMLLDQGDLGSGAGIRDGIFYIEFTLELRFCKLPPIAHGTAIRVDFGVVANHIHRATRQCKWPFGSYVFHNDTGRAVPPEPLIGHELSVQEVPIAVEPDIANDISCLLLGSHFYGNIIRVSTFELDLRIEFIPRLDQLFDLGRVRVYDHGSFLDRSSLDRFPIFGGRRIGTNSICLCPLFRGSEFRGRSFRCLRGRGW